MKHFKRIKLLSDDAAFKLAQAFMNTQDPIEEKQIEEILDLLEKISFYCIQQNIVEVRACWNQVSICFTKLQNS